MSNKDEEKNARKQIFIQKCFHLSSKTLSKYQTNVLLRGLKSTPTSKRSNTEIKSNIQNFMRRLWLAEFFQNKETNESEEIK